MGWKAGDPCGVCGSRNTHFETDTTGYPIAFCNGCGRSDGDDE